MASHLCSILCTTTIITGLALGVDCTSYAGPNSPNISPSMGGISSARPDFSMRTPNALRDGDTGTRGQRSKTYQKGGDKPRISPLAKGDNNKAGNSSDADQLRNLRLQKQGEQIDRAVKAKKEKIDEAKEQHKAAIKILLDHKEKVQQNINHSISGD